MSVLIGREKFGTWGNAALPTQPGDLAKTRSTRRLFVIRSMVAGGLEALVEHVRGSPGDLRRKRNGFEARGVVVKREDGG